jgi:hypothetical protein
MRFTFARAGHRNMTGPSIKGSTFVAAVDDVNALVDSGRIGEDELAERLPAADVAVLKQTISPAAWYDIGSYNRLVEVLFEVAGGGQEQYLTDRGAAAADRLLEAGVYLQLVGLRREAKPRGERSLEQRIADFGRVLRLTASLAGSIFNFGKWNVTRDREHDDRFRIEVTEAEHYPSLMLRITEGFLNRTVEFSTRSTNFRWIGERPAPDFIVYRMDRGVRDIET